MHGFQNFFCTEVSLSSNMLFLERLKVGMYACIPESYQMFCPFWGCTVLWDCLYHLYKQSPLFLSYACQETARVTLSGRPPFWSCVAIGALWHTVRQRLESSGIQYSWHFCLSDYWRAGRLLQNVPPTPQVSVILSRHGPDITQQTQLSADTTEIHRMNSLGSGSLWEYR